MKNKTATDLVKEAKQKIINLTPDQVSKELLNDKVALVDLRESVELETKGRIKGSLHVPRGILEFCTDPSYPQYNPIFDKNRRIILHCAGGSRSALAAAQLQRMGFVNIAHMEGGFNAWIDSGKKIIK